MSRSPKWWNWDTNPGWSEPRASPSSGHTPPSLLVSWPRAVCAGIWRALAHVWLWFPWVSCGIGSWQATEAGHPHCTRCSQTPWQMGCFQQEFHSAQYFAKVCPKVLWKIRWFQGKIAARAQASLSLRRCTGCSAERLLFHSGWESGRGVTQTCPWDRKLQQSLSVSLGTISGAQKGSKTKGWTLFLKGWTVGSLYWGQPGSVSLNADTHVPPWTYCIRVFPDWA